MLPHKARHPVAACDKVCSRDALLPCKLVGPFVIISIHTAQLFIQRLQSRKALVLVRKNQSSVCGKSHLSCW